MLHRTCRPIMTSARFDPTGRHVFAGTSAGTVYVFNVRTKGVSHDAQFPTLRFDCPFFRMLQD
jgi:hypothetical protein